MSENNKSYRIRTEVGKDKSLYFKLDQKFDILEILSLKLRQEGLYKLHTSDYGIIVGRVLANNGFGIPNAKVSVFIQISDDDIRRNEILGLYSYNTTRDRDIDGVRYNLLPDTPVNECHRAVGTFPSKTMVLDNEIVFEVFDKYYKYTTKTNESGDYMIFGVPTGNQTVHVDLDLSDIGLLSQRPRDFVYKGYTIEQFENPNQFKSGTELNGLSQIFSQDSMVEVIPFWGDENEGMVGISRNDVDIQFKFEPTCVFMGSVVSDNNSNGFSKRCIPTNAMGNMDELVTGNGTIEMIRKKPDGSVEEFQIQGTQLINGDGIWCYQIPMNLDYMKTDEYGNMVPTDNPEEGIPTRTRVRFRISMQDLEETSSNYFRTKVLVPHNPQNNSEIDYAFGSGTQDSSYRDLFWNNVYSVKSYIPRIQKSRSIKTERFSGIKHCNIHGNNNPIPYNNIRIRLPFIFVIICAIIKAYIWVITLVNKFLSAIPGLGFWGKHERSCIYVGDSLCPDLEGWYFAPGCSSKNKKHTFIDWGGLVDDWKFNDIIITQNYSMLTNTFNEIKNENTVTYGHEDGEAFTVVDVNSKDYSNREASDESVCLTKHVDYLIQCLEINLAQEYKVIQFDFYNDWINGLIYMPRWMRFLRKKRTFLFGLIKIKPGIKACMNDTRMFSKDRFLVEHCSLSYAFESSTGGFTKLANNQKAGCATNRQKCHKIHGRKMVRIFGKNGGLVNETKTMQDQSVYYFKPCEWHGDTKVNFFATDLCLLGSLNDCDLFGIPQAFKSLNSSSYQMPTNLALTNMEEDGYMYSQGDSGTICTPNTDFDREKKVSQAENTFSGANKYNSDIYIYSDNDDAVPLTEASGIDWGYTGPGQGDYEFSNNSIYQPGGHFLGISCTQSETNIKSCINLGRICEHGVGMSQRIFVPKSYDEKTNTWSFTNLIPNGFIAQDEIYDYDFRTMFASMNYNNLKTVRDNNTGYLKYDFMVSIPTNFDGIFNGYSKNYSYIYNNSHNKQKVDLDYVNETDDKEIEEVKNSTVRSLETTNLDYYRFRFGIKESSYYNDKKHFLFKDGQYVSMPVYENSFYFYFGLKDGATALDEFKKQFFSTCINNQDKITDLSLSSPKFSVIRDYKVIEKGKYEMSDFLNLKIDNANRVERGVVANIRISGGEMPYKIEVIDNKGNIIYDKENQNVKSIQIPISKDKENFGKYRIRVTDIEENVITEEYNFDIKSIFSLELSSYNYNVPINRIVDTNDRKENCDKYGGYISVGENLLMLGQIIDSGYEIKGYKWFATDMAEMQYGTTSNGDKVLYPQKESEGTYIVTLDFGGGKENEFTYDTFKISSLDSIDYWIGNESITYSKLFEGKKDFDFKSWYSRLNEKDKWLIRHYFTRQNKNKGLTLSTGITSKSASIVSEVAGTPEIMGVPDALTGEYLGEVKPGFEKISAISSLPEDFEGYDLSLSQIYRPTGDDKQEYQYIVYSTKGQFGLGYQVTGPNSSLKVTDSNAVTGLSGLRTGYRYLITNRNISLLPYAKGGTHGSYNSSSLQIDEFPDLYQNKELIENVPTYVYGFHSFPVLYKPFYFKIFAWSSSNLYTRLFDSYGEGCIYNGVTYKNKFSNVHCNGGGDITDNVIKTGSSNDEISTSDVKTIIPSSVLGIKSFQFLNGKITFSCTEGGKELISDENNLEKTECELSFKFYQWIKITNDTETGMLKSEVGGDTNGVQYYVINASPADKKGFSNKIYFPCITNDENRWDWEKNSKILNPFDNIENTEYDYGDWIDGNGLETLASYFDTNIPTIEDNRIPEQFKGSHVENITNQIGQGSLLSLSHGSFIKDAYILGVANKKNNNGSTICALYAYNKFNAAESVFKGTYVFGSPMFDQNKPELTIIVSISDINSWNTIMDSSVTRKCIINGDVSYTDTDIYGNIIKQQEIFNEIELKEESKKTNDNGGTITYVYSGDLIKYDSFTMKGSTSLVLSKTLEDSTEIKEVYGSDSSWVVNGEKKLSEDDYMWIIDVYGQNDNGKLKLSVNLSPYYSSMKGNPTDVLNFSFKLDGNKDRELNLTLNKVKEIEKTFSDVDWDSFESIKGEIIENPNQRMYNYDGTVKII